MVNSGLSYLPLSHYSLGSVPVIFKATTDTDNVCDTTITSSSLYPTQDTLAQAQIKIDSRQSSEKTGEI